MKAVAASIVVSIAFCACTDVHSEPRGGGPRVESATTQADFAELETSLYEVAYEHGLLQDLARRLDPEGLRPFARGGGPAATVERFWPEDAREHIAQVRCETLAACELDLGGSMDLCVARESARLAALTSGSCAGIETRFCVESLREGSCASLSWTYPPACSGGAMCATP